MADFSLVAELKANTQGFVNGIKKGEESLSNFGGVVDKILGPKGKLVMAVATATAAAVKLGQSMNSALGEITKGTGATGRQLEQFSNTLNKTLIKGVNAATKDIAKAMADINTRFKLTDGELEQLTIDFDKFATATGSDVAQSVGKLADVMKKWDIETKDASDLMDQLTVASQETGASVDDLLGELKTGQAVFSQLGMSATDTIAYLGNLKENGIDSGVAMTGLRTALAKFSKEGKNASSEFKNVSERIKNAKTETEALGIAVETFGARSGAEMVKVLRNSSGAADELKNKLLEAGGAVERTANATRTSKEAFKNLGDTLKASFSGLFTGLDTLVKGLLDTFNNMAQILSPIIMPLFNIVRDILGTIGQVLSELSGNIKEYVTEYNLAFNQIIAVTNSAYKIIHDIMQTIADVFGSAFGFIFSLMQGKFSLAWEYLKKTLMLGAKFILDIVSNLINAVKDQLNTLIEKGINPIIEKINWVQEKLGKNKTEKLSIIGDLDLSDKLGLDKKIEDTNAKIAKLSGKTKDKITADLGAATGEFDGATAEIEGDVEGVEEITEEVVASVKEKIKDIVKIASIVSRAFANTCKGIAKGFATAFQTVGKVVSKAVTGVKNAVSKMYSGIKKLTEFSIDDSLDALLKFEDGILTFVFETLPQMPQFLTQVFGSISIMFSTIEKQTGNMGGIFSQMISMITTNLPGLFESAINITTGVFTQLATAIQANAPEIVNAFGSMFLTVGNALPGIIDNLFATVGKLLSELGKYLTSNKEKFENTLKAIIASIINGLREFVKNGGLKNLLDGLLAVQQAIEEAVVDNIDEIAEFISEALPDIMTFLKNSIISASKTLGQLAPTLLKSLAELIGAIFAVAFDPDVIESSFDAVRGIISGLIQAIVTFVTKIIPVLIEALVAAPKFIPELISGILSGIIEGFATADWWGICEACFNGLIDGFKDLFGIHSPSTLFEGFGENIIEGLKIGLDGFGDTLETVMKPLVTFVDNLTNMQKIGDGLKKMFEGIAEVVKISGKVTVGVMAAIANAIVDIHNTLRDIIKSITTIKVRTPWKTYEIGGVDIGKVDKIDMSQYTAIMGAMDEQSGNNQSVSATGASDAKGVLAQAIAAMKSQNRNEPEALAEAREGLRVRAYASGTMSARRGLALVGEAGPELVNFRGGEQVLNNTATQRALNGGNSFNVVFNNTQDTTAFAMMQQLKAYNRQMAINGVL